MSVVVTNTTSTVTCPECSSIVVFRFEGTAISVCDKCRAQVSRGGLRKGNLVARPTEDRCRLRIGTTASYKEKSYTITGRMRFIFEGDGYVNLWHAVSGDRGNHWIAESYHTYAILHEDDPGYPLSHLLLLKMGERFTAKSIHYYLSSSETKTDLEGEGELPDETPEEKLMYVVGTAYGKEVVHFFVFNKKEYRALRGENVSFAQMNFQNTRTPDR